MVAFVGGYCRLSGSHMQMNWAAFLLIFTSLLVTCGGRKFHFFFFWLVEFHLPDRVLWQFGLKQEQLEDAVTNCELHKIYVRGKVEKIWRVEHAVYIHKWNDCSEYVCHAERIEEVMSRHHPYMVWYHRITRLYINRNSAKMEILVMCTNLFCFVSSIWCHVYVLCNNACDLMIDCQPTSYP